MKNRMIWGAFIALVFGGVALAQALPDRAKLSADIVFFTQPYSFLQPAIKDLVGLDLGLDYITIRYKYGFANTAAGDQPVSFRQRQVVKEADQLAKIEKQSGFKVGQPVTLVGPSGQGVSGKVVSFSYVGTSPSTIIVAADVRPDRRDAAIAAGPGLALRGAYNLIPSGLTPAQPLKTGPERGKVLGMCVADIGAGFSAENDEVMTASLAAGAEPRYFVSFWKRPKAADFEIDEIELYSCLFKADAAGYARANLPVKFRLVAVQDLDRDGKAEIFALAGDGAEICHLYMTPKGDGYATLKKGLCAGY